MADYSTAIETRYRDLDGMNHVNHAVFVTYMEKARNEFFEDVLQMDFDQPDVVVVSLQVDYKGAINWGDDVRVDLDVEDVGDRSFSLTYDIRADESVSATAESTQVTIDPVSGNAREIPENYRSALE